MIVAPRIPPTPRASSSKFQFHKPSGKPLLLDNIITDPSTIRKTTCFDEKFITNEQEHVSSFLSAFVIGESQINSILSRIAANWLFQLRERQVKLIDNIFNNIIAKACAGKLMIDGPLKQYLSNSIETFMDDSNSASEPTQCEQLERNTIPTKAAYLRALKQACLTYASNNALLFQFFIDESIEPVAMSDNVEIQQSLNFMRLFVKQNPVMTKALKSHIEELVNISMTTGLFERIRRLLVLQTPLTQPR